MKNELKKHLNSMKYSELSEVTNNLILALNIRLIMMNYNVTITDMESHFNVESDDFENMLSGTYEWNSDNLYLVELAKIKFRKKYNNSKDGDIFIKQSLEKIIKK